MNVLSEQSAINHLKTKLVQELEYVNTLTDPNEIAQSQDIIRSLQKCINNGEALQLIIRWNELHQEAISIIRKAESMNETFGHLFKLT